MNLVYFVILYVFPTSFTKHVCASQHKRTLTEVFCKQNLISARFEQLLYIPNNINRMLYQHSIQVMNCQLCGLSSLTISHLKLN